MVFLSLLNRERKRGIDKDQIVQLHDESLARMIDLLQNGTDASVLTISPLSALPSRACA
jgi:hypothetical protein